MGHHADDQLRLRAPWLVVDLELQEEVEILLPFVTCCCMGVVCRGASWRG
jgi:hypothetical protein